MEGMDTYCCRVCLAEIDCARNIFTGKCSDGRSYADALMRYVDGIKVDANDSLPSQICGTCVSRLETWTARGETDDGFVTKCVDTNFILTGNNIKPDRPPTETVAPVPTSYVSDHRPAVNDRPMYFQDARADTDGDGDDEDGPDDTDSDESVLVGPRGRPKSEVAKRDPSARAEKKQYECDQCDKSFALKYYLKVHRRVHTGEKPFECDRCDKVFSQKVLLTLHLRTHTGEKPYDCDRCDKKFSQRCALTTHLRTHTGEKPYECDLCDKTFALKNYLTVHRRVHTGEKPFACDRCKKVFSQKIILTLHLRTHTGEKPYDCDRCDKKFAQRSALNSHLRKHTGDKPYACDRCGKTFGQNGSLKTHFQRVHAEGGERA